MEHKLLEKSLEDEKKDANIVTKQQVSEEFEGKDRSDWDQR